MYMYVIYIVYMCIFSSSLMITCYRFFTYVITCTVHVHNYMYISAFEHVHKQTYIIIQWIR